MNKERRARIQDIIDRLDCMKVEIEGIKDEEEEYRDNIPENLQGSERYEAADEAIESLEMAWDSVDTAISYLDEAMGG